MEGADKRGGSQRGEVMVTGGMYKTVIYMRHDRCVFSLSCVKGRSFCSSYKIMLLSMQAFSVQALSYTAAYFPQHITCQKVQVQHSFMTVVTITPAKEEVGRCSTMSDRSVKGGHQGGWSGQTSTGLPPRRLLFECS